MATRTTTPAGTTTAGSTSPSLGERVSRIGKRYVLPLAVVGLGYWGAAQHFGWGSYATNREESDAAVMRQYVGRSAEFTSNVFVANNGARLERYLTRVTGEDGEGNEALYDVALDFDRSTNTVYHVNAAGRPQVINQEVNIRLTDKEGNNMGRLKVEKRELASLLLK